MRSLFSLVSLLLVVGIVVWITMQTFERLGTTTTNEVTEGQPSTQRDIRAPINAAEDAKRLLESSTKQGTPLLE